MHVYTFSLVIAVRIPSLLCWVIVMVFFMVVLLPPLDGEKRRSWTLTIAWFEFKEAGLKAVLQHYAEIYVSNTRL